MNKPSKATETALLPQYQNSAAFMERFLVAVHQDGALIERSVNSKGIKLVDGTELDAEVLSYFVENQESFRDEFLGELKGRMKSGEFDTFCDVVANEWFDGKRLREKGRPRRLKRSVHDYLSKLLGSTFSVDRLVQVTEPLVGVEPLISIEGNASAFGRDFAGPL